MALHTVGQSGSAHGNRGECTGAKRRRLRSSKGVHGDGRCGAPHFDVGDVGCLPLTVALPITMLPADASVEGVLHRLQSMCVALLQRAEAALQHPAEGTGLRRLQGPTVWSLVAGVRTRRATRLSAWGTPLAPMATSTLHFSFSFFFFRGSCA